MPLTRWQLKAKTPPGCLRMVVASFATKPSNSSEAPLFNSHRVMRPNNLPFQLYPDGVYYVRAGVPPVSLDRREGRI